MRDNPAIQALWDLASMETPRPSDEDLNDPLGFHEKHAAWLDLMKIKTAHTFNLMEQHRIPHHQKLKAQHDRGMLLGNEYAMALINQLFHA